MMIETVYHIKGIKSHGDTLERGRLTFHQVYWYSTVQAAEDVSFGESRCIQVSILRLLVTLSLLLYMQKEIYVYL